MATSDTTKKRQQYRSNSVRLNAVGRAAALLLDTYTWQDSDGRVMFTTEPNISTVDNPALMDFEVKSRWAGLRASLLIAGIITGEQEPGYLAGGLAKFLVVQTLDLATADPMVFDWQTRAEYEVLTGVNSYGYADGAALDAFYDRGKRVEVRVQLRSLLFADRADYLMGDRHGVISTLTIGNIAPFSTPDVSLTGWACIGDRSQNPEPNYFGLDSPRVIIIPTGLEGPQGRAGDDGLPGFDGEDGAPGPVGATGLPGPAGPEGPAGPRGPRGLPGAGGTTAVAPVVQLGHPMEGDEYVIVQALRLAAAVTGEVFVYEVVDLRCVGGDASDESAVLAGVAVARYLDENGFDENARRAVGPANPGGVVQHCKLIRVQDGSVIMSWQQGIPAQQYQPGSGLLINLWLGGALIDAEQVSTLLRAGTSSRNVQDFAAVLAPDGASVFEHVLGVDGSEQQVVFTNDPTNLVTATRWNDDAI